MKTIILVLLTFLFVGPAWAENPPESPPTVGPESTLNTAAQYVDSIFMNALASLELVASTPEAKSGDWQGIKPYLKQLEHRLPGVYFFVLPNGNYYSVALDYTNLNLTNRPYFKSLFAGNQVKGFPIYSRSSGKKSALVAAPIVVNDQVTGALGASIFLDDLAAKLDSALALPQDYNWFVLNSEGNDMLDRDMDFIFMNALTQGSKSLREAVSEALKSDSGTTQYELGKKRHGHYRKLPSLDWRMFLVKIEGGATPPPPQLQLSLDSFVPELQNSLDQIDGSLAKSIEKSNVHVDDENEIRKLLGSILKENILIVEAAFVDANGILRYIEPADYKNFENSDISSQEHVIAMRENPGPQLSSGFMAVEHFIAVVIERPLYDSEKHFVGSINLVIRPELLIDSLLKKGTIPADYELWIMQPDGMIIYDQDMEEIGRMLFSDPMYAGYGNLLELSRNIAASPIGEGSYIYLAPEQKVKVIKNAIWQTVRLHNRDWRVVLAYRPYD